MWDYTKHLSESLSKKVPELSEMLDPNTDRVAALEELVNRLLSTQHQVADSITERVASVPGLPKPMLEMTEQMHGMAATMLKLQAEVWTGWFGILRQLQGAAVPQPPAKKKSKAEPPDIAADQSSETAPSEPAPVVEPATSPGPEAAPEAAASAEMNDLKVINGVGPAIERKLNEAGIFSYRQIAGWNEQDIDRVEATVLSGRFAGKIRREDWVGQAKSLIG